VSFLKPNSRLLAGLALSVGALCSAGVSLQAKAAEACPDLSRFYASGDNDWPEIEKQLAQLKAQCLLSSEFFALHGAAQLNSGLVSESLESLERALLLDPDNGAAQIDYGQALFQQGQLFMALEINERLLARQDLPAAVAPSLKQRQKAWRALTRQRSVQLDTLAGYDNNLNGAPDPDQVTLTLSGENIPLTLNSEFSPVSGPYLNMRLGGRYRALAPSHQHNWAGELRARTSEDSDSNLVQFTSRYAFVRPQQSHSWQANAGVSHLNFGGKALFSGLESSARYSVNNASVCKPFYDVAVQYQLYHEQDFLNGIESRASVGVNCPLGSRFAGNQRFTTEFGLLNNHALKDARLGGNRNGWQFRADWQMEAAGGTVRALASHTQLDDTEGFSPLLANNAERELDRSYILLQYRRPIRAFGKDASLLINFYRQTQNSNIEFFRTDNTSGEIGVSFSF
jgi:tetratricopeptide (TPR) repeat protein